MKFLGNYDKLLSDIKSIIASQKLRMEKATNMVNIQTYWLMGERIHKEYIHFGERSNYGQEIIEKLSKDLEVSMSHIHHVVSFHRSFPILQQISPHLSWSHYLELLVIKDPNELRFYETQAICNRWSVRETKKRIKEDEYQKFSQKKESVVHIPKAIPSIYEVIKDVYDFSFIELQSDYKEQDMEYALLLHMGRFLLELGYGFTFVGNQYKIFIGQGIHRIDLLFFHIPLCCYVIVDIKTERFCDQFVGQMNKYLTYFRERECYPYMNDPIGLIICKEKDSEEVHYALGKLSTEIFVAEYCNALPKEEELKRHLQVFNKEYQNLNHRQIRVIQALSKEQAFTTEDYKNIAQVSIATARRDVADLLDKEKIIRHGQGKNTMYEFKNS